MNGESPGLPGLLKDFAAEIEEERQKAGSLLEEAEVLEDNVSLRSFQSLYEELLAKEELILQIDSSEVNTLRTQLSYVKNRHMRKLRENNIKEPPQKLEFIVLKEDPQNPLPEGQVCVKVILRKPRGLTVHKIVVPGGSR